MKYNVYYQSYTLASINGGVSDYFTVEIDGLGKVEILAEAYGIQLFSELQEIVVCVICDEVDMIESYFRVDNKGIHKENKWTLVYRGLKAMITDEGAFVANE